MKNLIHFDRWRLGLAQAEMQTTPDERDYLAARAAGRRCLVEVGVWHGVTTRRLLEAMSPEIARSPLFGNRTLLRNLGEACRVMIRESLRTSLTWAIEQVTQKK